MVSPLVIFLLTLLLLPTLFLLIINSFPIYFTPSKRRSGILSFLVSSTMTILSVPFVWEFVQAGGDVKRMNETREAEEGGRRALGELVCMSFGAYLVCDLGMGWLYYRQNLTFINGLIHHTTYLLITTLAVLTHQPSIFALAAFLELPTFFLALANVFPKQRNDWVFAGSFLLTRIGLHSWICWAFVRWGLQGGDGWDEGVLVRDRRIEEWAGVFFLCLAFPLHVHWFKNNALGMLRRSRLASSSSSSQPLTQQPTPPSPSSLPTPNSTLISTQLTTRLSLSLAKSYPSTTSLTNYSPTSSRSSLSLELEEEEKENVSLSVEEVDASSQLGLEMLVKM